MFMFISSLAATIAMTTACNSSKLNELNRIRVSRVPSTNTISKSWMVIHNKKKLATSASLKRVNFSSSSSSSLFYLSYSQVFILLNLQSSFGVIGNKLKSIAQYFSFFCKLKHADGWDYLLICFIGLPSWDCQFFSYMINIGLHEWQFGYEVFEVT